MGSQAFPGILTCAAAVAATYLLRCVRDEGCDTRRRVDGLRQGLAGLRCKVDALQAHVAGPPAVAEPAFSGATAGMARTGAAAEAGGWGRESEQRADSRPNRIRESFRDGPKGDRTLPWRASGIAGRRALSAARKVRGHALLAFTCSLGSAHLDCLPIGAVNAVKAFDSLNPPPLPRYVPGSRVANAETPEGDSGPAVVEETPARAGNAPGIVAEVPGVPAFRRVRLHRPPMHRNGTPKVPLGT